MPTDLYPLVVPLDKPTTLTLDDLTPGIAYLATIRSRRSGVVLVETEQTADQDGKLYVKALAAERGEYWVDLYPVRGTNRLARLSFFAVPPELAARRPLRCDFHIHTLHSDGRNTPAEMLIRGRELGLDVAVITDHNAYAGSIEGLKARRELDLNLISMPGEEVSSHNWHILSIGATASIYDQARKKYDLERDPRDERWLSYSALCWAVETTQAQGGRAYLAHPYWTVDRGFHLPTAFYDQILAEGILDGIELLGDVKYQNNVRSLARYLDLVSDGHQMPILGNSDTHAAQHTYGVYWTQVWAEDLTPAGVLDAIRDGWSVACTTIEPVEICSRPQAVQAFGPFELVDYATFLEHHFYPLHDALCQQEAAYVYRAWRGETLPARLMEDQRAQMEALYQRCGANWGL